MGQVTYHNTRTYYTKTTMWITGLMLWLCGMGVYMYNMVRTYGLRMEYFTTQVDWFFLGTCVVLAMCTRMVLRRR